MDIIYKFDSQKNRTLKKERSISFDEIIFYIEQGNLIDVIEHPNKKKYSGQRIYLVEVNNYVYLVPFYRVGNEISLITIFPSRKHTKKYINPTQQKGKQNRSSTS